MWIPKDEEEIVTVATSKSLEESAVFDAKKEVSNNTREIAKDIAAMANDGGVLFYGLGEDENKCPCVLNPIDIAGQPERITSIVQTSISEPPQIIISTIRTSSDPAKGYIIVVVPVSERAPHMVIVRGENRYYGRTTTGNKPLTEADVARLYERRKKWEVDRDILLSREIENSPIPHQQGHAYLFLFSKPVSSKDNLLDQAIIEGQTRQSLLRSLVEMAGKPEVFPRMFSPDFHPPSNWVQRTEGLLGKMYARNTDKPKDIINLQIDFNGSGHLFCGRAAELIDGTFLFFPSLVAGITIRFLKLLGELYDKAKYLGMVDIGVGIIGLQGSIPYYEKRYLSRQFVLYDRNEYNKTDRVSSLVLKDDPEDSAKRLLMPIFDALSQNQLDPFNRN